MRAAVNADVGGGAALSDWDAVVVGAGVAGLAVARVVAESGLRVVVLEARDRVGGRIWTVRVGAEVIELGAEFVHGRAPELWELIEEAGLETYERVGTLMRAGEDGPVAMEGDDGGDEVLEGLEEFAGPDCSFREYVGRLGLSEEEVAEEVGYVEGFNAADAGEASAMALGRQQRAEGEIEGERNWRVAAGYDGVTRFLRERVEAAGGKVVLGAEMVEVEWGEGAEVRCADGRVWRGRTVVVTVPLGVLQAGGVRFSPEPARVLTAAGRMRMGRVSRATLVFRRRIWPEEMSFLLAREVLPGVWWSARGGSGESLTLTGWVGGPRAEELLGLAEGELEVRVVAGLAGVLGLEEGEVRKEMVRFYTHDWEADVWTRGAYSWVPVGGLEASAEMSEPVQRVLFFAGEHTDTSGHWGTVHGALRSGLRAGRQVLEGLPLSSAKPGGASRLRLR